MTARGWNQRCPAAEQFERRQRKRGLLRRALAHQAYPLHFRLNARANCPWPNWLCGKPLASLLWSSGSERRGLPGKGTRFSPEQETRRQFHRRFRRAGGRSSVARQPSAVVRAGSMQPFCLGKTREAREGGVRSHSPSWQLYGHLSRFLTRARLAVPCDPPTAHASLLVSEDNGFPARMLLALLAHWGNVVALTWRGGRRSWGACLRDVRCELLSREPNPATLVLPGGWVVSGAAQRNSHRVDTFSRRMPCWKNGVFGAMQAHCSWDLQ